MGAHAEWRVPAAALSRVVEVVQADAGADAGVDDAAGLLSDDDLPLSDDLLPLSDDDELLLSDDALEAESLELDPERESVR